MPSLGAALARLAGLWPVALSVAAGLAVGGVTVALYGGDPLRSLAILVTGIQYYPDIALAAMSVLVLTGLAFAIPLRVGLFNIGAEGLVILGAVVAVVLGSRIPSPLPPLLIAPLLGALVGLLVAVLRLRLNVNEVLSTIMINWTIYWVTLYLVAKPLADPQYPNRTVRILEGASLPRWPSSQMEVLGITIYPGTVPSILLISVAVAAAAWLAMFYTLPGLRYRFVGANEAAARLRGTSVAAVKLAAMAVAGALAALAGALLVLGYTGSIDVVLSSVTGYGFEGIGVALVGKNHPLGIVVSSLFFSSLRSGSAWLQIDQGVPDKVADMVNGAIVFAIAALSGAHLVLGSRPWERVARLLRRG